MNVAPPRWSREKSAGDDAEDLVDLVLRQRPAELGRGDHETAGELDLVEHRVVTETVVEWFCIRGLRVRGGLYVAVVSLPRA